MGVTAWSIGQPFACPRTWRRMGVPDLERFGRVLRLRWLWQEWTDDSKLWVGTKVSCKDIDRLLFNASTTIIIGNGHKAQFWHHAWLEGEALRYLVPNLFKLARRKNRAVNQELHNGSSIRSLRTQITTTSQIREFIDRWIRLLNVQLQEDVQDSITWKWTADEIYSTRSTYRIQF
jgi:hypothetical protein